MMATTTLYVSPSRYCRTVLPAVFVKRYNISAIELVEVDIESDTFKKEFPWQKVPVLIKSNGEKLTESMAILYYLLHLSNNGTEKDTLLGQPNDIWLQSQIIRWESFSNSDFLNELNNWVKPLVGLMPYNEFTIREGKRKVETILTIFEERLMESKNLAADYITIADLVAATSFSFGFTYVFDKVWRVKYPYITAWFNEVINSEYLKEAFDEFKYVEEAPVIKSQP